MKNYEKLIQELLCEKFTIMSSDFHSVKNIVYVHDGITVTFGYYRYDEYLVGCERIYNSEINAFIFETLLNK